MPSLKKIDLTLGENHEHPDLEVGPTYLIKYRGRWHAGKFCRVWFGWSFNDGCIPYQYDKPGTNSSGWEECYLIEESQNEEECLGKASQSV